MTDDIKGQTYIHVSHFIDIYITTVFSDSFNILLPKTINLAENKLICRNLTIL